MKRLLLSLFILVCIFTITVAEEENEIITYSNRKLFQDDKPLTLGQLGAKLAKLEDCQHDKVIYYLEHHKDPEDDKLNIADLLLVGTYVEKARGLGAFCTKEHNVLNNQQIVLDKKTKAVTAILGFSKKYFMRVLNRPTGITGNITEEMPVKIVCIYKIASQKESSVLIITQKESYANFSNGDILRLPVGAILSLSVKKSFNSFRRKDFAWDLAGEYIYVSDGTPAQKAKPGDEVICIHKTRAKKDPESKEDVLIDFASSGIVLETDNEWLKIKQRKRERWVKKEDFSIVFPPFNKTSSRKQTSTAPKKEVTPKKKSTPKPAATEKPGQEPQKRTKISDKENAENKYNIGSLGSDLKN